MKNLIFPVIGLCLTAMVWLGCKKPDNAGLSNGIPECDPGYFRDGNQCRLDTSIAFIDDWGKLWNKNYKDSLWHVNTSCLGSDSIYIYVQSFDSSRLPYRRDLAFAIHPKDPLQSSLGSPFIVQNYWPDAVKGDSVIWEDIFFVWGEYFLTFRGRFNLAQDSIKGKMYYHTIGNGPDLPDCPVVFTKAIAVQ